MPNNKQKVKVSDTTGADSSNTAGTQKRFFKQRIVISTLL